MSPRKTIVRALALAVLIVVIGMSLDGFASPEGTELAEDLAGEEHGSGGGLVLLAALAIMVLLGSPLFVIIGVLAAMCFVLYGEPAFYDPGQCTTLSPDAICGFDTFPAKMADLTSKNVLLAIPFFVVSGAIMSAGDIANRLVAFAKALVGWMPGGLAVATVGGCIFFAAISGSSPVTVIAIGSMMYPALVKAGYDGRFSMGLVTTAGSLGILIPPSIPMLVFAIVAGGRVPLDVGELFLAGILPGALIGVLLSLYSMWVAHRSGRTERSRYSFREVADRFRDGFWAVMLPVVILGGIYSGLFTPTEAAAVSVIYALVVELCIHREIGPEHLPKILSESAVMMGTLLIIMALAFGLNDFLVEEKIPDMAVESIRAMKLSPLQFLLIINLLLLVVGALMDSISAIVIIAPLLKPIADQLGIDPVHLGVIFIVNLEIGYLTPPIGINLFVASAAFKKPLGEVIKSVIPFIGLMFVGLGIVTYVPTLSVGPVNVLLRDEAFYEPLPQVDESGQVVREEKARPGAPEIKKVGEVGAGGQRVLSMEEMSEIVNQMYVLCDAAETVMADDETPAAERLAKWRKEIEGEEVTNPEVLAIVALVEAPGPDAYAKVTEAATAVMKAEWTCEALEGMLKADGAGAEAEGASSGDGAEGASASGAEGASSDSGS
ncbi:TRAP transporter large permease [Paraliomyxa miuraensis]|uniref:TRAP transporter large permease n=1 Tax=Paraliomyxa miuraensis TaxID=376150 RepID=UPI00225823CA|nr:TRAP transporter large permease [Paraliomyxa miuraensis]MCX4247316.1 TRAP transporter large permease [Paraliomyxa miuraensis]